MSLAALVLEFNQQAENNKGNITVNADSFSKAGLTTPPDLDTLLQKGFNLATGESLLINIGSTPISEPSGNTLTIKGQAGVLNVDAANTDVSFVITDDGSGNVQFTILIALSSWTFATSWQYMTGGIFSSLPYTRPAFIFSSSKDDEYTWQDTNITLVAGQNFACIITLTGILQQVVNFLTSWSGSGVVLSGKLDPSKVNDTDNLFPELDLIAPLDVAPIQLLFLNVESPAVGFKIISLPRFEDDDDNSVTKLGNGDEDPEPKWEQFTSLYFQLKLKIGSNIKVDFTAGITPANNTFFIGVTSDPKEPVTFLDLFSLMAGNNWFNILPPVLQQFLNKIAFKTFAASIDFNRGLSITNVSTTVGSNGAWVLFDNFVINEFDVQWIVINPGPGKANSQSIILTASVDFWKDVFDGSFDVEITSALTLSASFSGEVTFGKLVSGITYGAVNVPDSLSRVVVFTGFGVEMDINNKYFSFNASTNINIDFITPNISVTNGSLLITSSSPTNGEGDSIFTAAVSGLFAIGSLQMDVNVDYSSSTDDGGWNLGIAMPVGDSLNLGELMKKLFEAISLPSSFLPDNLLITQFSLAAYIPNAKDGRSSYEVKTGIDWKFTFPIIDQRIDIIAKLWIKYETVPGQPSGKYSGGVMGSVLLEYFNAQVNIGYNFSDNNQNLMIQWEGFMAEYNVTGQSQIIKFSIQNWTLGGLLTSFMKMLFDPTFELDSPWDILNSVSLDGFSVTYDLNTKEVKVKYALPKTLNLVFININGISLTKNSNGVFISFDGTSPIPSVNESSLFKPGTGQDVKKMPEVPGQGNEYFDLRLLAMGQHVALANASQYQTIPQVTDAMQKAFTEPASGKIPIGPGSGNDLLYFDEDSNWLIATNFGILNVAGKDKTPIWTVDMQVVFNDPNLYGLYIALNGAKAKVLAGLKFEIMYKKISDSVGVYQIDLTLPDALRNLQFGAVNITLPSISLEIYTNGDFMVDIGFPYNMDFSRSFTLQAIVPPGIPAMGSGGFYFGKLSSATTNKVPATSYGNFNPVLVFGIGLQVGVGYSVNYGLLKAGFSITLFGIIEGVIATYHPYAGQLSEGNPQQVETSYYYYLRGTVGVIGKLYGSIDFGIISASVNITIMVYVQATFEAYNKIPLSIVASVSVSVAASLNLGIFSITIHFSFTATIRQDLTIGTDQTAKAPWNNNLSLPKAAKVAAFAPASSRTLMAVPMVQPLAYKAMLAAAPQETLPVLNLYFVPHITITGNEHGSMSDQNAAYVATLFIDAPNPDPAAPVTGPSSFEYLCADFFRWLIQNYAAPDSNLTTRAAVDVQGVSKEDLDSLMALLSNENNPFPIPTAQLLTFLQTSFKDVNIQVLTENLASAAIFPMFYDLGLSVPGIPLNINFSQYNMATTDYLKAVKKWFAQLAVQVEEETATPLMKKAAGDSDSYSLSTFVFEDYFVLIGKQLAGFASDAMDNFTYHLAGNTNGNSLQAMVNWANTITADGSSNQVKVQDVATANQDHPLTAGKQIAVTGNMHQIASGDNFFAVAALYAITPSMLILQSGTVPGILAPQALKFNGNTYQVLLTDTMEMAAAGLKTTLPVLAADLDFQKTALLQTGGWLIVSGAIYSAKNEDTFASVATLVYSNIDVVNLLMQNQVVPGLFIAGNTFVYGGVPYPIVPGDTLASMAVNISELTKTVVTAQNLAESTEVQGLNIQPLGLVLIQPFNYTTVTFTDPVDADTLLKLATKYNTTSALLAVNYANQQLSDLFYSATKDYVTANVPGLKCLDVASILQYFTDNGSYGQLSGMVSRYQLHGMRLPTNLPGLTLSPGSPCPADGSCALFSLTGQQFALPAVVEAGFTIELTNSVLSWLLFDGKPMTPPDPAILEVKLTAEDATQIKTLLDYAQKSGVKPDVLEMGPMEPFNLLPVQYTFQTATKWQTSGQLTLPYGSLGTQNTVSPIIWAFPSGMLRQIALPKVAGSKFSIQIGQYDAAKGVMNYTPSSYYSWSTMVEIDIKRLSGETTAAVNAYTYELLGASEAGALLLQRLLMALNPDSTNNNKNLITDIQWLYEGDGDLLSVGMESMKSFIVQANLSTETNPTPTAFKAMALVAQAPEENVGILNSTYDFIRLLWECSITRSGGYYLLYNETESNAGFPDAIFGKGENATIRLMVTYSSNYNNIPANYMNCAVTGDKIDDSSCVVYAESAMQKDLVVYVEKATDTLASITARYNILLSELAALNENVVLNTTPDPLRVIHLTDLVYEVGRTGLPNNLSGIVSYYDVDAALIQQLNPGITDWNNLPEWQLIRISPVDYTVSDVAGKAGNTLLKIAAYYFIDMATLAWAAKDVQNLFVISTPLKVNDQILHKVSSVPQGTAGFELTRTSSNPQTGASAPKVSDPDYAKNYLNNLYNLLSYQVVGSAWFDESIIGLPVGPGTPQSQDDLLGKSDNNTDDNAPWIYNQVVPIAKYAKQNDKMSYPAGFPDEANNPYRGIGHQVQVHFDWVDYYGNNTITPFSDPAMDPAGPLNNLPIEVGYTDELKGFGKWPSLEMSYVYDMDGSKNPELTLEFNFNNKRYVPIPDVPQDQQQDWKKNASNDLIIYTNIYYQLTQLDPASGENTLDITLISSLTPGVKIGLDPALQLLQFVKDVYLYLQAILAAVDGNAASLIPVPVMAPIKNIVNVADINTASILQLSVVVDFARKISFVDTDFRDSALVTHSPSIVKPKTSINASKAGTTGTDNGQHSLNEFAAAFEDAFFSAGNYELKIATGTNSVMAGSDNSQAIFVVRMGLQPGKGIYWNITEAGGYELTAASIDSLKAAGVPVEVTDALSRLKGTVYMDRDTFDTALQTVLTTEQFTEYRITIYTYSLLNPVFYAPKPLATSLISKSDVPICKYVTGEGLVCNPGDTKSFTGIDMDNWGLQSLSAIDVFLTSDYSVPAFLVDQLKAGEEKIWLQQQGITDADTFLEAITNAKKTLAEVISGAVEPILTAPYIPATGGVSPSLDNAQKQFGQQLLNQLSNAYNINALVQLKVTAESDFTTSGDIKTPPRLYGVPVIKKPAPPANGVADNDTGNAEYSISTAKVQLNEQGVTTDSYLTFSFTTKNAKDSRDVSLDMSYVVTHIEFEISDVPGIEGYQGSNWLTFIIPASVDGDAQQVSVNDVLQKDLGTIDIPVVLRNYPTTPTLTTQAGDPVPVSGASTKDRLEKASQWNYVYAYTGNQVAQDKIFFEVEFNLLPPPLRAMLKANLRDLFNDMAQLVTVWPQVLQDFNTYLTAITAESTATDANLTNAYYALQTFVTLTNNLSLAWQQYNGVIVKSPNAGATKRVYDFIVEQEPDENYGDRLLLTIVPQEDIPAQDMAYFRSNSLIQNVEIPEIPYVTIDGYDKKEARDKDDKLIPNAYWYLSRDKTPEYLSWDDAKDIPSRTVHMENLNVLQYQYAWAGLSVIRNEDLILFNPTVADFIYRTPLVKFSNKLIPLLSNDDLIDIARLTDEKGVNLTLAQQIANFLRIFFTDDKLKEQLLKLSVSWNYPLIQDPSNQMPAIQLPVLLVPPFTFEIPAGYTIPDGGCLADPVETDPFVCRLAAMIKAWFTQINPVTTNAWIQFDLSVFSSLSESKLPLIDLSNIVLYYKNITDLK